MVLRLLLVANSKAPEVVEPCVGPLDDPANRRVMAGPLLLSNLLDVAEVSGFLDHSLAGLATVSLVEAEELDDDRAWDDDGVQRGLRQLGVVAIRAGQDDRQRVSLGVRQDRLLDASLSSVGGVAACGFVGLAGLREAGVHALDRPLHQPAFVSEFHQRRLV